MASHGHPNVTAELTHVWRVRTRLPQRFGERCRVLIRGGCNSCLVEFADGSRVVTSRNYLRRVRTDRGGEESRSLGSQPGNESSAERLTSPRPPTGTNR